MKALDRVQAGFFTLAVLSLAMGIIQKLMS